MRRTRSTMRSRASKPRNRAAEFMPVVVVTDSSARLPEELRRQWAIRQVPLHVLLDDTDLRDGVDDIPDNIHDYGQATTAAATPAELSDAYRRALEDSGGDGVVAVHVSAALSGTVGAAERCTATTPSPPLSASACRYTSPSSAGVAAAVVA